MSEVQGETITGTDAQPTRAKRGARHARTETQIKAGRIRSEQMKLTGKPIPSCPMTPEELMSAWSIGQGDAMGITVKILKQKVGQEALDLMDSVPLVQFDGRVIAANFGPGRYLLRPAAGSHSKNSAVLPISDELARSCGWGKLPVTPQDAVAERVIRGAAEAPTDPLDLLAAVQQVVRRELAAAGIQSDGKSTAAFNPMDAMQEQMGQMQAWLGFMDRMEAQMQARVERRLKLDPEEPPRTNQSLLEALLPLGMKLLDRMTEGRTEQRTQTRPAPQPTIAAGTQPAAHQTTGETVPELPQDLTPEEKNALGMAAKMLRPFATQLVDLGNSAATDAEIVAELEGYVPQHMIDPLVLLGGIVERHGAGPLAVIALGLATERWRGIMIQLGGALKC